jgi:hypothetical protein
VFAGPMLRYGRRIAAEIERILAGREHPLARALVASRGARGSGLDGAWTRRDHRRAVILGIGAVVLGWAIALGIFPLADRYPSGSRWNTILTGAGLFFMLGGMFIGWQSHKHIRPALRRSSDASDGQ